MLKRVTVALMFVIVTTTAQSAVKVGQSAPDFAGLDTKGQNQSLSSYRGKVVVLEWTNHDCPFVRKHYGAGNMQAQQREATQVGVIWLSIISSAPGRQGYVSAVQADRLTVKRNAAPTAVVLDSDGTIGRDYGAKTTPHMYIIDSNGILVYKGGIDSIATANPADIPNAQQYVRVALKEILKGKEVSKPVTRPYGYSVKY